MDAYQYAGEPDAMEYLYDFFDEDLPAVVRANRELIPEGLEDLLAEDSLEDYVWLWLKDRGRNGFLQYIIDGGFSEDDVREAHAFRIKEWAIDNPPHVTWFREDGSAVPVID
ncbi:hypothetical protein [uncultured Corynebacterium sp.]|uniref:hypothetical protein n=1 Tax=uncultured Corynebacterium sp. TaxID=159447 RepID=UPI0025CE83FD|nr:hypothetical protein [uncultured Corynebacterium sp.]